MLSINVPLAIVAMATMPVIGFLGVGMRKAIFPVSWLIQARLARLATVVDENIQGVRIVKSFAAEGRQLRTLAEAADRIRWAYLQDARIRSRWTPVLDNLPRLGLALVLLFGGIMVIRRASTTVGTIVAFNSYVLMLQPPFRMLGMMIMMGQRASASAARIYEILDTHQRRGGPGPTPVDVAAARGRALRATSVRVPERHARARRPEPAGRGPGETVAVVGAHRLRQVDPRPAARPLLRRRPAAGSPSTGTTCATCGWPACATQVGIVPDEPFLFSLSMHDNIAYGRPDGRPRGGGRGGRGGRRGRVHPATARGLRHGGRRARLHALRRPAAADRDRPGAAGEPADPGPRRRDQRHRRDGRAAHPLRRCATDAAAARR